LFLDVCVFQSYSITDVILSLHSDCQKRSKEGNKRAQDQALFFTCISGKKKGEKKTPESRTVSINRVIKCLTVIF
jgi:hypothetical protein